MDLQTLRDSNFKYAGTPNDMATMANKIWGTSAGKTMSDISNYTYPNINPDWSSSGLTITETSFAVVCQVLTGGVSCDFRMKLVQASNGVTTYGNIRTVANSGSWQSTTLSATGLNDGTTYTLSVQSRSVMTNNNWITDGSTASRQTVEITPLPYDLRYNQRTNSRGQIEYMATWNNMSTTLQIEFQARSPLDGTWGSITTYPAGTYNTGFWGLMKADFRVRYVGGAWVTHTV